jgi:hypothetical protein
MPLNTQLTRKGKLTSPTGKGWNGRDVNAIYTLAYAEAKPDMEWREGLTMKQMVENGDLGEFFNFGMPYLLSDEDVPLVAKGKQTLKKDYTFDADTDEPMVFKKGDVIEVWRD